MPPSTRWTRPAPPDAIRAALDLVGLALIALFLVSFVGRNVSHQGDLKTYLAAGAAVQRGLDPYRPENLIALAGHQIFPFVYPPIVLPLFVALAGLPAKAVAGAWMWGKIALLAGLILAWGRWFAPRVGLLPIALVAVFGWNSSAQWDLASGNVALIECGLLWTGFGCYLAGRRGLFAAFVVAAACFKLVPAAFLLLLLVPTEKAPASPARFWCALAILALLVGAPTVFGSAAGWQSFWRHIPDATDYGAANPGSLGLASALARGAGFEEPMAGRIAAVAWGAYAAVILALSRPILERAFRARDARVWILGAVFLDVLLTPRPMAYGFALVAPAPLFFLPRPFRGRSGALLLGLLLSAHGLLRLTSIASQALVSIYAPFLLTLCVWLLVIGDRRREATWTAAEVEASPAESRAA